MCRRRRLNIVSELSHAATLRKLPDAVQFSHVLTAIRHHFSEGTAFSCFLFNLTDLLTDVIL